MSTRDHIPFRFILLVVRNPLVQADANPSLCQISNVHHIAEQIRQYMPVPGKLTAFSIVMGNDPSFKSEPSGRRIPFLIQHTTDFFNAYPGRAQFKNLLHNGSNIRVNNELTRVFGISPITVGLIGTHKISPPPLLLHRRTDFPGEILCIGIIDQILQRCHKLIGGINVVAVVVVIDRNKADPEERENLFQVVTGFHIVTPQSGQILHNDAVDFAAAGILHHPLELRSVKIRSGTAVIRINACQL